MLEQSNRLTARLLRFTPILQEQLTMSKKVFHLALCTLLLSALSFPADAQQPKKIPRIGVSRILVCFFFLRP